MCTPMGLTLISHCPNQWRSLLKHIAYIKKVNYYGPALTALTLKTHLLLMEVYGKQKIIMANHIELIVVQLLLLR